MTHREEINRKYRIRKPMKLITTSVLYRGELWEEVEAVRQTTSVLYGPAVKTYADETVWKDTDSKDDIKTARERKDVRDQTSRFYGYFAAERWGGL